jgi:hypothetical protein
MSRPGRKTRGRAVAAQHDQRRGGLAVVHPPVGRSQKAIWVATTVVAIAIGFAAGRGLKQPELPSASPTPTQATVPALPKSYRELLAMSSEELAKVDLAAMNLLCTKGLPGAERLDIPSALAKFDEWAARVKFETQRHLYRLTDPRYADHYAHSEPRLRAEFIVQCLQEDCGAHYNHARIDDPDFRDLGDCFIHGLLPGGNGGTCGSMPVLCTWSSVGGSAIR